MHAEILSWRLENREIVKTAVSAPSAAARLIDLLKYRFSASPVCPAAVLESAGTFITDCGAAEIAHRGSRTLGEDVHVAFADRDGTRRFESARDLGILAGYIAFQRLAAGGGAHSGRTPVSP